MKVTIDIDCTPEEARQFLGLPDVRPLQDAMLAQTQEQLSEMLRAATPEDLVKLWLPNGLQGGLQGGLPGGLPGGLQGMEAMQKMFLKAAGLGGDEKD
jgi:hypothetical protein